jgi:hypothetical protein
MKNSCQTWSCALLLASVSAAMMACELGEGDVEAIDQTGEALESERLRGAEAIRVSDDPYDTVDGEPYSPERHSTAQFVGVFVHIDDEGIARVHGFTTPQAYDEFMLAWRSELPERDSPPALGHARFQTLAAHEFSLCEHHWPSYGDCLDAWGGVYEPNLTRYWLGAVTWNDVISSAWVAARTHVTLYEHIWYQGNWYDFANTSWNDYWYNVNGWFNDQASSFVSGNY